MDVETSMNDTIKKMTKLKITTADSGPSIITAARKLLKAGAKENQRKKTLAEMDESIYIESDEAPLLAHHQAGDADVAAADNATDNTPNTPTGNEEANS